MDEVTRLENTHNYIDAEGKEICIADIEATSTGTIIDAKGEYAAITPKEAPSVLTWNNLCVSTKPKRGKPAKVLLNNISGNITGGLWGIMGASGSGKTTFLSTLSLRLDTHRMQATGDIRLNGKEYVKHTLKSMSGYVMQDDLLNAFFTVQETLEYAAALRMEAGTPYAERKARCDEVLKLLGIDYCRDVIIGDTRNKGISGGERKRVCVAMELLTRPKLLFLDEPTSGLDSTTALSVMQTLKDLAERGECTIVCTIHQPQTKIYNLLDNLLLMKKGEIVYQGAAAKADPFFAAQGYPCPEKMNPADHLLDIVTVGTHDHKEVAQVKRLEVPINLDFGLDKNDFKMRAVQPWAWQFCVLFHRNLMEKVRRWDIFAMNIFITCIVATFIGMGAWHQIDRYQTAVNKNIRNGILFFCVIHQGVVSSLQGTYSFPLERALMLRERAAGSYYVSSYFLSKTTVDTMFQVVPAVVFTW
jgi:ATP-binding cassette subfamily G (WHITE) protein 2